jgi:hypothetical protein
MSKAPLVRFDELVTGVGRFTFAPSDAALYDQDTKAAASLLNSTPEDVERLAGAGLPHRTGPDGGPLFDFVDVMNMGRFSRSRKTVPEALSEYLMRFACEPAESWLRPKDWLISVRVPPGAPRYKFRVPDLAADGVEALHAPKLRWPAPGQEFETESHQVAVRVSGVRDEIRDSRIRDVQQELLEALHAGKVTYQVVVEPLRLDHQRAWSMGVTDCMVISRMFVDRVRELGIPARAHRGYLLGLVSSEHAWSEVYEDGRWKTVDVGFAFMPSGLTDLRVNAAEFVEASFGSRCNHVLPCVGQDGISLAYDADGQSRMMVATISATSWKES